MGSRSRRIGRPSFLGVATAALATLAALARADAGPRPTRASRLETVSVPRRLGVNAGSLSTAGLFVRVD
jgi:hypothetical protein